MLLYGLLVYVYCRRKNHDPLTDNICFNRFVRKKNLVADSGSVNSWLRGRSQESLGHNRGVVVRDLPLSVLVYVNESVTSLNLITSGSHGELVDSSVLAPSVSNLDVRFEDLSLWLLLQESYEVILDKLVVGSWYIRNGGEKTGRGSVTGSNLVRILSGKSIIPKVEQGANSLLIDGGLSLRENRGVVLRDLPLSVLEYVYVGVTSLDLLSTSSHGELVDSSILGPVGSNNDVSAEDLSLGLVLEEVGEVVNNSGTVGTGDVGNSGKKNSLLGVTVGNLLRVKGGKGSVPESEEVTYLVLGDGLGGDNSLRHNRGVVVGDLPLTVLVDVDEGVTSLDLLSGGSHGELVDTAVLGPVVSDDDVAVKDLSLRLELQEVGEIVLNSGEVGSGGITDSGEKNTVLGVTLGNLNGVKGGKGVIPEVEQVANLLGSDGLCGGSNSSIKSTRGDGGGLVVLNSPCSVLLNVDDAVGGIEGLSILGNLVNSGVNGKVVLKDDVVGLGLYNGSLEEVVVVLLDLLLASQGSVGREGLHNRVGGVKGRRNLGILSAEGGIVEVGHSLDLSLGSLSNSSGLSLSKSEDVQLRRGAYIDRSRGEGIGSGNKCEDTAYR